MRDKIKASEDKKNQKDFLLIQALLKKTSQNMILGEVSVQKWKEILIKCSVAFLLVYFVGSFSVLNNFWKKQYFH